MNVDLEIILATFFEHFNPTKRTWEGLKSLGYRDPFFFMSQYTSVAVDNKIHERIVCSTARWIESGLPVYSANAG